MDFSTYKVRVVDGSYVVKVLTSAVDGGQAQTVVK